MAWDSDKGGRGSKNVKKLLDIIYGWFLRSGQGSREVPNTIVVDARKFRTKKLDVGDTVLVYQGADSLSDRVPVPLFIWKGQQFNMHHLFSHIRPLQNGTQNSHFGQNTKIILSEEDFRAENPCGAYFQFLAFWVAFYQGISG